MPLIKTSLFSQQFIVGSETTSTTLLWTMLYLLHHEDVQARVHWEIEKVDRRQNSFTLSWQNCRKTRQLQNI